MDMTFTFNPLLIHDGGLNQVRFELGDCLIAEHEKNCYLSDEEILAALANHTFKRDELRLLESLLARFAYEVDMKVDKAEWSLSQRVTALERLRKKLIDELALEEFNCGVKGKRRVKPIFKVAMHDWR